MDTREALVRLGDRPIKRSPISKSLVASLNAHLETTPDDRITKETPGDEALARVYKHPQRDRILTEQWGVIRDRDSFSASLVGIASIITLLVFAMTVLEVYGSTQGEPGRGVTVLTGTLDFLKWAGRSLLHLF